MNLYINLRAKNVKVLKKIIGINLCDLEGGNGFLHIPVRTQVTEEQNR